MTTFTHPSPRPSPTTHRVLNGHTSFETAHIDPNYPASRRLFCKRAVWLETATLGTARGQNRFVYRTSNPRSAIEWNEQNASHYIDIGILLQAIDTGAVSWTGIDYSASNAELAAFRADWYAQMDAATQKRFRAFARAQALLRRDADSVPALTPTAPPVAAESVEVLPGGVMEIGVEDGQFVVADGADHMLRCALTAESLVETMRSLGFTPGAETLALATDHTMEAPEDFGAPVGFDALTVLQQAVELMDAADLPPVDAAAPPADVAPVLALELGEGERLEVQMESAEEPRMPLPALEPLAAWGAVTLGLRDGEFFVASESDSRTCGRTVEALSVMLHSIGFDGRTESVVISLADSLAQPEAYGAPADFDGAAMFQGAAELVRHQHTLDAMLERAAAETSGAAAAGVDAVRQRLAAARAEEGPLLHIERSSDQACGTCSAALGVHEIRSLGITVRVEEGGRVRAWKTEGPELARQAVPQDVGAESSYDLDVGGSTDSYFIQRRTGARLSVAELIRVYFGLPANKRISYREGRGWTVVGRREVLGRRRRDIFGPVLDREIRSSGVFLS